MFAMSRTQPRSVNSYHGQPLRASQSQPNDVDRRRIERALDNRERYRYVRPTVEPVENGYRIISPCCSRNIDPEGGAIDIARLEYDETCARWNLYSRDHEQGVWVWRAEGRLSELLVQLNTDPQRIFWQ
jgi:hypothetical protein